MDIKTLSAVIGHVSSATTLDIYTHITDSMRQSAADSIDQGIGKVKAPKSNSRKKRKAGPKAMTDFQPYKGKIRKPGTGCISRISENLWEGRYSPIWPDGKKHPRNIYAHSREECEEKLSEMIAQVKAEIAAAKAAMRPS